MAWHSKHLFTEHLFLSSFCGRGKNTGVGYHSLPQEIFWPRNWTHISSTSCIGKQILYHCPPGKPKSLSTCLSFSSVQSFSSVWLFVFPWTAACQAFLSINNFWSLLKLMPIESVMPANHLILCCPLLLPPSIFPNIRVFSNELVLCIQWPNYWSFSFSISPSNEYSGLISFRIDWLDLLAVEGTLKSLLQHHSSKHQFFGAQLSL